jgi:uncharacterized protein YceK
MKKIILSVCLVISVSGCSFVRTVTFSSADNSYQNEGSKANLEVFSENQEGNPCAPEMLPTALIAAAGGIILNVAESEIQGYIDEKKQEFTANYSRNGNFYNTADDELNCLRIQRTVKGKDGRDKVAFEWLASIVSDKEKGVSYLHTESIYLNKSAARTDSDSQKLDVSIEVKFDVTAKNEKGIVATRTLADKTLNYPGLELKNAVDTERNKDSSFFPIIPKNSAVNVAVKVTEVGTGGDDFGTLGKQIDDNKKSWNDAIEKYMSEALTPAEN